MITADRLRMESTNNSQKFSVVLRDLRHLLEREKSHLMQGGVDKLESFAREKMQMFANLNHLAKSIETTGASVENRSEVINVNSMLNDNLSALKSRMDAISEITKTIEDAINESESDGTYDASSFAKF
ncbi:MAG: hypothetical protein GY742_16630 [Hyphomicrobiales bacterium]|nr:hypothetical protein [Hyphomicrobiales bacterium]